MRWSGSGAAVEAAGGEFVLTARAENLIRGVDDLDDTIARLQAYEAAGADVLYAPGLRDAEQVRAVCSAVGKPVNVLAHRGLSMAEIVDAGGQRVSVGGALGWVAARALVTAARQVADGDFSALTGPGEIAGWLEGSAEDLHPAVDLDHLAGHVVGVGRGEEGDRGGHVRPACRRGRAGP